MFFFLNSFGVFSCSSVKKPKYNDTQLFWGCSLGIRDEISHFFYSWVARDVISTPYLLAFSYLGVLWTQSPSVVCISWDLRESLVHPEEPSSVCSGSGVQIFFFSDSETQVALRETGVVEGKKPTWHCWDCFLYWRPIKWPKIKNRRKSRVLTLFGQCHLKRCFKGFYLNTSPFQTS